MFENSILLHFFELGKKLVGMKVGMMVQGIDLGLEGWRAPQPPEKGKHSWRKGYFWVTSPRSSGFTDSQQVATPSSASELLTSQVSP